MSKPFIDVIIPTYNNASWLESTLESVLVQTYENIKIYIVDDGSEDNTEQLVRSIRDKRLNYIKKKNGGVSSARNVGIKHAGSPYIAFLDADDIWAPTKLEKQVAVLENDPELGMVYGHHYVIDEEDVVQRNLRIWKRGDLFNELVNGNCIAGSASMVLVKRSVLDEVGLFREDLVNGEDWEMWMRIARISKIDFVPEIIASIRVHSKSAQQNTKKMTDCLVYLYDVAREEFDLTTSQQRLLASYCLFNSAVSYYQLKDYSEARRTLWRLFKENPPAWKDLENWKLHVGFGIFSKIISSQPALALLLRIIKLPFIGLRYVQRACRKGIRFARRVVRYGMRRVKGD